MATTAKPRGSRRTGAAAGRSKRRRRRDLVRSRLIGRALELAETAPFEDLTIDEIATGAGLSRSAFYLHFRDKHDLLLAAVQPAAGELEELAGSWWEGEGPPAQRVQRAVEGVVGAYAVHAGPLRLAAEVSTYDEEVERRAPD
jgi:AcrR family transcriptional regulator